MKSEANIIPKYLNLFMLSNSQSKIERDNEEIVNNYLLLPINIGLVLESFKVSLFAFTMLRRRDLCSTCSPAREVLLRSGKEQHRQRTMIPRSVE